MDPSPSPHPSPSLVSSSSIVASVLADDKESFVSFVSDYEVRAKEWKEHPFSDLFTFPADDVSVLSVKKKSCYAVPSVTPKISSDTLGTQADSHVKLYADDYTVIQRNYAKHGTESKLPSFQPTEPFPDNHWPENELGDPEKEAKLFLSIPILRGIKPEDECRDLAQLVNANRECLFDTFPVQREGHVLDHRVLSKPYEKQRNVNHILVECAKLQFALGDIEPFFCSASLYDLSSKKRISEAWSFSMNTPKSLALLGSRVEKQMETNSLHALFNVHTPSPDIYMMIRVEKVLRGVDLEASIDPYAKGELKAKEIQKLEKEIAQTFPRLADFKQPFAWGALQLFDISGNLIVSEGTSIKLERAKSEDSEASILEMLKKRQLKEKKISSIPCDFIMNIKSINKKERNELNGLVDPSYIPVNTADIPASQTCVRDIQDFSEFDTLTSPSLEFLNNLYVYPETINFNKHKDSNSRNITVTLQIKDSDLDLSCRGVSAIYGNCGESVFTCETKTAVTYHKKVASYSSEMKVAVPPALQPKHHLFFTFSHVVCQAKGKSAAVENILGYAAVPLFLDHQVLKDGSYTIPVATTLVPGYLTPEAEASLKWVDNKKPIFTFSTRLCSTVLSQDGNLTEFFRQCTSGSSNSKQLSMALRKLSVVEENSLAQYFPVLLNLLLKMLCSCSGNETREIFECLLIILARIAKLPKQSTPDHLLHFYIQYIFKNPSGDLLSLPFLQLAVQLAQAMAHNDPEVAERAGNQSKFILPMIIKSLALDLHKRSLLNKEREAGLFSDDFLSVVEDKLIKNATFLCLRCLSVQSIVSKSVALFLKDLFTFLDRGFVQKLCGWFITRLSSNNAEKSLVSSKFKALKIICCYEHFVPLNLPAISHFTSVTTVRKDYWKRHYLVGLLIDEVDRHVKSSDLSARLKALTTLRDILWKLSQSPLIVGMPDKCTHVVSMFFPFLFTALEQVDMIEHAGDSEKREWSVCVLFIIAHCHKEKQLHAWWSIDTEKNFLRFLALLRHCLTPLKEERIVRESSFIVLQTLEDMMRIMRDELNQENSKMAAEFFATLMQLCRLRQTVSFFSSLALTIRRYMAAFPHLIFAWEDTHYCEVLCYELLKKTNSLHVVTRSEAGSLLYMMIKLNFKTRANFERTKLQATIAISKLCGEFEGEPFIHLQSTLNYASMLAQKEFANTALGGEVDVLVKRLFSVIKDSMNIARFKHDPEMVVDLTYSLSLNYKESPDLRLTWLQNLISCHRGINYEEIAQCQFLIAALIVESLSIRHSTQLRSSSPCHGLPKGTSDLAFICPNVEAEPHHPQSSSSDEKLFNSVLFSEKGFIDVVTAAAEPLKLCQRYETCIDMNNLLLDYYQTRKDYNHLTVCFKALKEVANHLVETDKSEGRLFSHFYRVQFWGRAFGVIDGKEMIYKESAMVRVAEFTDRLKQQFSGLGTLNILSNHAPVDVAQLDVEKDLHVQIIAVLPYFSNEAAPRKTEWENNFNVNEFIYETPFTESGKAHGDLSVQCKRKTILTTEKAFPYVKKRIQVAHKRDEILTPLYNAIEIIQARVKALRREMQLSPPNPKTLQIQLQGAVLAQVNAGPLEIAKIFLGPNAPNYCPEQAEGIEILCKAVNEFMNVCKFALKLNETLIASDQIEFQRQCESSCAQLQKEVQSILQRTEGSSFYK